MPDLHPDYRPNDRERALDAFTDRASFLVPPIGAGLAAGQLGLGLRAAIITAAVVLALGGIVWLVGRLPYPGMSGRETQAMRRVAVRQSAYWWRVNNPTAARAANVLVPVLALIVAVVVAVLGLTHLDLSTAPALIAPILAGLVAGASAVLVLAQAANQITSALQRRRDARD